MHVKLAEVGHRFADGPWLFRNVNIEFRPGNTYSLTGPSGSGKSTLLSMLAKLDNPQEGAIAFHDVSRISWVPQNPLGTPRRTAIDHVVLPLMAKGSTVSSAEDRARDLLAQCDLSKVADRPFRELSGGEGQRLMLARGLATAPDLLLVDEPTAQLDRRTAAQVDSVLASIAAGDAIVIVATHDHHTRDACTHTFDLTTLAGNEP